MTENSKILIITHSGLAIIVGLLVGISCYVEGYKAAIEDYSSTISKQQGMIREYEDLTNRCVKALKELERKEI